MNITHDQLIMNLKFQVCHLPMNFWTSSDPETRMNVHSVWWATARASNVFPERERLAWTFLFSRRRFDIEVLTILTIFTIRTSAGGAIEQNSFGLSDAKGVKQLGVFYGQFDHLVKTM